MFIFLLLGFGLKERHENSEVRLFIYLLFMIFIFPACVCAKLGNSISENRRQYGKELITKTYVEEDRHFAGKKVYPFWLFGWEVEAIFRDGKTFSESARPKGSRVKKKLITESEANVIADMLFPKKDRGAYRKQVKNANFISHFFENGVVSFEMELDQRRKNHVGVKGVRTILYSNGEIFKDIKVNAYQ